MKRIFKSLYYVVSLFSGSFLAVTLTQRIDFLYSTVEADVVGQMNIAVTCQAAPVQVWTSPMLFEVSWSGATQHPLTTSLPEVSLSLENPVVGESVSILEKKMVEEGTAPALLMAVQTPAYKMTGLSCRPYSHVHVNSYAQENKDSVEIAFAPSLLPGLSGVTHRIDRLDAQNSLSLIGQKGVIKNASLVDGQDMGSQMPDGQIIVGGKDAGIIKTILNLRDAYQNISQPVVLSMQAF